MADPFPDPDLVSFPHPPQRVNVNSAGMDATSEPSSKRKRTESTDTQSNPLPTRSKEFWLDDGSIVLHVENTLFRVHRTQLSANSEVFRNMFSVPQPALKQGEEIEGCPIVRLPDLAADWTYVLVGLYDASYVKATKSLTPVIETHQNGLGNAIARKVRCRLRRLLHF